MSIEKIKKPLEKLLNRLNSLEEKGALTHLDRDHLGNLLIQAYDELMAAGNAEIPDPPKAVKNEIFEFEEDQSSPQPPPKQEISKKEEEKEEEVKPAPTPEKEVSDTPSKAQAEPPSEKEEIPPKESDTNGQGNNSDEIENLFRIKESTELSERLSQLPISDIWNAMGLNERIFTQNELFDGDHEAFQSTVQKLNGLSNFEEAREELISGAAKEYEWASGDRKNIAKNFIRLVKRRYKW